MLTDSDVERFNSLMEATLQRREERIFLPDRDEEKIAEILNAVEMRAAQEHSSWLEAKEQFASSVKYQPAASNSEDVKTFPKIDRYRNFEEE